MNTAAGRDPPSLCVQQKETWVQGFKKLPSSCDDVHSLVPWFRCVSNHDRGGHQDDNDDIVEKEDISVN